MPSSSSSSSSAERSAASGSLAGVVVGAVAMVAAVVPLVLVVVAAAVLWRGAVDASVARGQQLAATTATLMGVARESGSAADLDVARAFVGAAVDSVGGAQEAAGDVEGILVLDEAGKVVIAGLGPRFSSTDAALQALGSKSAAGVVVDAEVRERDRSTQQEAPAGRVLVGLTMPPVPWRIVLGLGLLGVAIAAAASLAVTSVLRRRVLDPLEHLSRGLDAVAAGRVDDALADVDAAHAPTTRPLREVDALVDAFDAMVRGVREREGLVRRLEQAVGAQVASDPAALERPPQRQAVSVVVVDVRDFTPLQSSLSPEVAGAFVDSLLTTFVGVVERHGGHVERFLGDGLIALFGAPLPAADHVARACACASDLEVAARHLVETSLSRGIPRFVIGVGVATGPATVGAVGPPKRRVFQAMGDVPALARKVQQEAKNQGFGVLVTEEVHAAARDSVPGLSWKKLPPLVLRGVGMPVTLYRVERVARANDDVTAVVGARRS